MIGNRRVKGIFTSAMAILLVLCALLCLASCNGTGNGGGDSSEQTEDLSGGTETQLSYDDVDVEKYIDEVTYKGLEIALEDNDVYAKEEKLWDAILATAKMDSYPEDKVDYFFNQMKRSYMYLVDYDEEAYEMLLNNRSTTEEDMRDEARKMVKKDLVYRYIVQTEKISVTDEEKSQLFEKYVDKYVTDYGYNREYVELNMTELIYESMLYDKTVEFLLANNEIISPEATDASEI